MLLENNTEMAMSSSILYLEIPKERLFQITYIIFSTDDSGRKKLVYLLIKPRIQTFPSNMKDHAW